MTNPRGHDAGCCRREHARWAAVSHAVVLLAFLAGHDSPARADSLERRGAIPIVSVEGAVKYLGVWIWDKETRDKQICHLWRQFEIPKGAEVLRAQLRITADNAFTAYLDGRELGRGSDWRTLSAYDLTWLLSPGPHVLAVEGFNDVDKAGVIVGFRAEMADGRHIDVRSDEKWLVAPVSEQDWLTLRRAPDTWPHATVVGVLGQAPWWKKPTQFVNVPPIYPVTVYFWERGWFQIMLLAVCGLAALACVWLMIQLAGQARAQRLLHLERVRIARDIHDDLGARLTQLLLTGEEAQRQPPGAPDTGAQFDQMCNGARGVLNAIDEVVWIVNAQRDTLSESVIYICKYAEAFLRAAAVRCRFDVPGDLPDISLDLPCRRNLLLTVKECLSNAVKHSGATEVSIRFDLQGPALAVVVEDNGSGFEPGQASGARHGLRNMIGRMKDVGGDCRVDSARGRGCRVAFTVPLPSARTRPWGLKWPFGRLRHASGPDTPE
jgi:signal transduction histidine kinase